MGQKIIVRLMALDVVRGVINGPVSKSKLSERVFQLVYLSEL